MINTIIESDVKRILSRLGTSINALAGKRILITGASGLIGSYLVETLAYANDAGMLSRPCTIIGVQKSTIKEKDRLGYLLKRKGIHFVSHNASTAYKPRFTIDYFIHAAGMSAPAFFLADPLATIDVNVQGIRWILEYAKKYNSQSVLYMSSGEIYGNPPLEWIPTPETYPGNVSSSDSRACYTASKRLAETLCFVYHHTFGVPVKVARPFIVYGPGLYVTDRRVMADFIRSGIAGKPIEMLSAGLDTRSYCYIADATVAFLSLLLSAHDGEVFNVASDLEEVSIKDIAHIVHKICDIHKPVRIKKQKATFLEGAPNRVMPDISKLKQTFGYVPEVGIEEGLRRTIEWNKSIA